jgi:hypothetical protein
MRNAKKVGKILLPKKRKKTGLELLKKLLKLRKHFYLWVDAQQCTTIGTNGIA